MVLCCVKFILRMLLHILCYLNQRLLFFATQLTFEGIRGPDYKSDLAIDDISVSPCNVPSKPTCSIVELCTLSS
mgnify:CR=1 FL=1